jgi:putative redox protein
MLPVSAAAGGPDGPSPTELLAAGLAACTTIYVARNAAYHGIALNSVEVTVRADREADDDHPIRRMVKDTVVTGDISAADFERVKFFADYCAIGNSLIRGIEIDTDLNISSEALGDSPAAGGLQDLPPPDDPDCVDGTCCIP